MPHAIPQSIMRVNLRDITFALAATLALLAAPSSRAAPIHTGVEAILWPVAVAVAPFVIVHDFVFGSDDGARSKTQAEADRMLAAHPGSIPVNGLHTGSLPLTSALFGMLAESRLPFVEIDTAGSQWFLSQAKDPQPLIALAQQHRHIRLSIGDDGHPDCFVWTTRLKDFTRALPIRPNRCLRMSFVDTLESNTALEVDISKAAKRRLQWVLKDRASETVHLAAPFWQSQVAGRPLSIYPSYRTHHEDNTFVRVVRKLAPSGPASNPDGSVHLLWRIAPPVDKYDSGPPPDIHPRLEVLSGVLRPGPLSAPSPDNWDEAYAFAYASGKPVIVNDRLLLDPRRDRFGPACGKSVSECSNPRVFMAGDSVLSVGTASGQPAHPTSRFPAIPMRVYITSHDLDGRVEWKMAVVPDAFPEQAQGCHDVRLNCNFYVTDAGLRDGSVVVRGRFTIGPFRQDRFPAHEVELIVPLAAAASESQAGRL